MKEKGSQFPRPRIGPPGAAAAPGAPGRLLSTRADRLAINRHLTDDCPTNFPEVWNRSMVKRKAKKSPSRQAQIEAAETALKMARQNAKAAKARVRALRSELKAARKRHKRLRKDLRAAKHTLAQVNKQTATSAARPVAKKKPSVPKPLAAASVRRRKRSAARKQATQKASAVQAVKPITLARRKNPRPAARPMSKALALQQPTSPTVAVPETEFPLTNATVN